MCCHFVCVGAYRPKHGQFLKRVEQGWIALSRLDEAVLQLVISFVDAAKSTLKGKDQDAKYPQRVVNEHLRCCAIALSNTYVRSFFPALCRIHSGPFDRS